MNIFSDNIFFVVSIIAFIVFLLSSLAAKTNHRIKNNGRDVLAENIGLNYQKKAPNFTKDWRGSIMQSQQGIHLTRWVSGTIEKDGVFFSDLGTKYTIIGITHQIPFDRKLEIIRNHPTSGTSIASPSLGFSSPIGEEQDWTIFSDRILDDEFLAKVNTDFFINQLPDQVTTIWTEDQWLLGSLPQTDNPELILKALSILAKISADLNPTINERI